MAGAKKKAKARKPASRPKPNAKAGAKSRAKTPTKPPVRAAPTRDGARWVPTGRTFGPGSHLVRAGNLERADRLEEARDAYRLAISEDDAGTGAELLLLGVLSRLGDADGVIELADTLTARGVGSVVIGATRARALTQTGRWEDAILAAQDALKIDRNNADAWEALGGAYRAGGDNAAAAAASAEVVRLAPNWEWGWFDLGNDLKELGRYMEAAAAAAKMVELDPDNGDGWYNLACFRACTGHADEALEALERAVELDANNATVAAKDTDFAQLHDDGRFKELVGRV